MKQVREIISARMIELNRPGIAVMDSLVLLFVAKIIPWIPQSCVDELSRFAMPSDQKILNSLMIMRYPAFDAAIGEVIDREIDREINVSVGPTLQ
jgi:rRNA-processing protein FCF1